jgi:hypothetical protein
MNSSGVRGRIKQMRIGEKGGCVWRQREGTCEACVWRGEKIQTCHVAQMWKKRVETQ